MKEMTFGEAMLFAVNNPDKKVVRCDRNQDYESQSVSFNKSRNCLEQYNGSMQVTGLDVRSKWQVLVVETPDQKLAREHAAMEAILEALVDHDSDREVKNRYADAALKFRKLKGDA